MIWWREAHSPCPPVQHPQQQPPRNAAAHAAGQAASASAPACSDTQRKAACMSPGTWTWQQVCMPPKAFTPAPPHPNHTPRQAVTVQCRYCPTNSTCSACIPGHHKRQHGERSSSCSAQKAVVLVSVGARDPLQRPHKHTAQLAASWSSNLNSSSCTSIIC